MKKIISFALIIALSLSAGIFMSGCANEKSTVTINCYLMNSTAEACNLWIGHDDKPPADSLVGVKGSKIYIIEADGFTTTNNDTGVTITRIEGKVRVNAGKDGVFIKQEVIDLDCGDLYTSAYISWDGTNFTVTKL